MIVFCLMSHVYVDDHDKKSDIMVTLSYVHGRSRIVDDLSTIGIIKKNGIYVDWYGSRGYGIHVSLGVRPYCVFPLECCGNTRGWYVECSHCKIGKHLYIDVKMCTYFTIFFCLVELISLLSLTNK